MAKGIGLIGNFKGKVGNMVGYKLSDSNTGNTQGIRVYQPIVRNPKTSAQAEQRAKLAPINATYRALKMIIDRGNEGLPYGNKSRLAWLKQAFKAQLMPWYVKGANVGAPVLCPLTKGSLSGVSYSYVSGNIQIAATGVTSETTVDDEGAFSVALMAAYPNLKKGDQITFVGTFNENGTLVSKVKSFIIDPEAGDDLHEATAGAGIITFSFGTNANGIAVIVSREGTNGEHLRSAASLVGDSDVATTTPYDETSKDDAIASYQASASANADWAEESIQ